MHNGGVTNDIEPDYTAVESPMEASSKTMKRSHQQPNTDDQLMITKSIEQFKLKTKRENDKIKLKKNFSAYKDTQNMY